MNAKRTWTIAMLLGFIASSASAQTLKDAPSETSTTQAAAPASTAPAAPTFVPPPPPPPAARAFAPPAPPPAQPQARFALPPLASLPPDEPEWPRADWSLAARMSIGPSFPYLGAVNSYELDIAFRPQSFPIVVRVEGTPIAYAATRNGSAALSYMRALAGVSLKYFELSVGGGLATDGTGATSGHGPVGVMSVNMRAGRQERSFVSVFADAFTNDETEKFYFGRFGVEAQFAVGRQWRLRFDIDYNAAGYFRTHAAAHYWLSGHGEAGSVLIGGKLGVLGIINRDPSGTYDGGGIYDDRNDGAFIGIGPVVGLDTEFRF